MLRILGPNCVGLIVPAIGLNASFAHATVNAGRIAFVSQSGALVTAVLDWARTNEIGFSHFVSLGNSADVDFGDVLDYLGSDPQTRADPALHRIDRAVPRKFMSAARAAARNKPVIVVKAGRVAEGERAAASHTGALAGSDDVYDAAIRARRHAARRRDRGSVRCRRDAGAGAAAARRSARDPDQRRWAGVMATDAWDAAAGELAALAPRRSRRSTRCCRPTGRTAIRWTSSATHRSSATWQRSGSCSTAQRPTPSLFIHAPPPSCRASASREAVVPLLKTAAQAACWPAGSGGDGSRSAPRLFHEAGIATYDTPEEAVGRLHALVDYRRNQDLLMETPPSLAGNRRRIRDGARSCRSGAGRGPDILTEPEAKAVLAAYGIPVVETRVAQSAHEAAAAAQAIGFPVALKILSRDISHKSDVGGVVLDLDTPEAVATRSKPSIGVCAR